LHRRDRDLLAQRCADLEARVQLRFLVVVVLIGVPIVEVVPDRLVAGVEVLS
jgi:hypothetical protein